MRNSRMKNIVSAGKFLNKLVILGTILSKLGKVLKFIEFIFVYSYVSLLLSKIFFRNMYYISYKSMCMI